MKYNMPRVANDNFKPRHTLSWGTEFLMMGFAIAADLVAGGIFLLELSSILLGFVVAPVAGGVAGAALGSSIGGSVGASVGGMIGSALGTLFNFSGIGTAAAVGAGFLISGIFFFIGILFTCFIAAMFWLWFKIKAGHGVRRGGASKRPLYMAINAFIKSILGFVPGWTVFAFLSILELKKEDARYNKKMNHTPKMLYRTGRAANDNQPRYQKLYNEAA